MDMLQNLNNWFNQRSSVEKVFIILVLVASVHMLCQQYYYKQLPKREGMSNTSNGTLVLFYATWCPHCHSVMPSWDHIKKQFNGRNGLKIIKLDGDKNKDLTQLHNVDGFPSIKFLPNGINSTTGAIDYNGDRSKEDIIKFLHQNTK